MKVILLAGGFGTRLSEYTEVVPKPMVKIGGKPILWHIMKTFAHYGHNDFYIALGYKAEVVKEYFMNYRALNSDFTVNLGTGALTSHLIDEVDWNVTLVNTGLNSMTGGRIRRMHEHIGKETFLLTYGDGLSDVNLDKLIKFHKTHGKMITMTAVRPGTRFGELELDNGKVVSFEEKPQLHEGWINGGYFVVEPEIMNLITGDEIMLEREPLVKAAKQGELMAYSHEGFWQCMDTKRDLELLTKLWEGNAAPWNI
jgi:glucose-1-phosphate cytidylyltransferase